MKTLLLSGGMDSVAIAYWMRPDLALTIDYGQRPAAGEVRAARTICSELGIPHEVVTLDLALLGLGSLAGREAQVGHIQEWWPFRNQMLITVAAMRTVHEGAGQVIIGSVRTDTIHSDGRQLFFDTMNELLAAQEPSIEVIAPGRSMTSLELIRRSGIPLDLLGWTISCHVQEVGCGECSGCAKHIEILDALGRGPVTLNA